MYPILALTTILLTTVTARTVPRAERYEDVAITDLYVRMLPENGTVTDVSFKLSGSAETNLTCSQTNPGLPSPVFICGQSKYRFALYKGKKTDYALRVYHELGLAWVPLLSLINGR